MSASRAILRSTLESGRSLMLSAWYLRSGEGGVIIQSVLLALLTVACAAAEQVSDVPATRPSVDARPRLAIIGFEADASDDSRDTWIPVALEELLARRLQRVPELLVLPTIRLYQAHQELAEPNTTPPWMEVVRGLGAGYVLSGRCRGPDSAVTVELTLRRVGDPAQGEQRTTIPPQRVFEALDAATRWTLEQFKLSAAADGTGRQVFAPPSESPLPVEYYARAVAAMRAEKPREAMRYANEAIECDKRFRPALLLLAQMESQIGPAARESAGRRLRAVADLARMDADPFDRVRSEIGRSLLLQAEGAFEAACTRAETALSVAFECQDVYGQMAAITTLCDLYLLWTPPTTSQPSNAARLTFARNNMMRAAEWQRILLDTLDGLGDVLAGLPAANKLALIYERLGQPDEALKWHEWTLAKATALHSRRHEATAWLYLGQWYRSQQRWPDALEAITRCLALAEEARSRRYA